MKLRIDETLCTGHGMCFAVAPALFTDDERGYGQPLDDGEITPENLGQAEAAIRSCPERAISRVD